MKRTDFTQNFPGGIIKGDSRCREGEEMEEKIDLNVCYRKAFEAVPLKVNTALILPFLTVNVQPTTRNIAELDTTLFTL